MSETLYPDNKKFAFTILDDTDSSWLSNVEPIYQLLESLGMRTTKTVWPLPCTGHLDTPFSYSATLADQEYLEFVRRLVDAKFEVTWHGPSMVSSVRNDVIKGLHEFNDKLGFYPKLHVNHATNLDNLYWGISRFDNSIVKKILAIAGYNAKKYSGEKQSSDYYWGDYAKQHFSYCRSFSFHKLDSLKYNPSVPYIDPKRKEIDFWFSTADADNVIEFEKLVTRRSIDQLIESGGLCILSTHLGKGFCVDGKVRNSVKEILEYIATKNGWFAPVSEILDWRRRQGFGQEISSRERSRMEYRWLYEQARKRMIYKKRNIPWWEY